MNEVEFDRDHSLFSLNTPEGRVPYRYIPDCKNVWDNLEDIAFTIVLLNNPFLHKETDVFEVKFNRSDERGGFLFPIEVLESEEEQNKQLLSYMLVAFRTLLAKVDHTPKGVLSEDFRDAFILAVHNDSVPDFSIEDYLLSLAINGFYVYQGALNDSFPKLNYFENMVKTLRLEKMGCKNMEIGYVQGLIRRNLCATADFLTRFVLLYQVVELFIAEIHRRLLDDAITKYKSKELKRNDFGEELKEISKESFQINILFKGLSEEAICLEFISAVKSLFSDVNYKPKSKSLDALLYALRNQIFHNYGLFVGHEDALIQVIFCFERVILLVLGRKIIIESNEGQRDGHE